jgi:ATP-dependent helicase HrpA
MARVTAEPGRANAPGRRPTVLEVRAMPEETDVPAAELRRRLATLTLRDEHRLQRRLHRAGHDAAARAGLLAELDRAEARAAARRALVPAVTYPPELPISARRDDLLAAIAGHQVVVVAGETGSGKSTQLPKLCLELGRGVRGSIAHTQPRRLAARTIAERVAAELGVGLGATVGYAVRFDDRSSEDTLLRLVTDGLLLAEIGRDKLLRRYDTVIVDEAHERSLNVDFLLGYLKQILPRRPDLKLIITSATIDPERFSRHFDGAPVVEVSGRTYPVELRYRPLAIAPGDDGDDETPGSDRDVTEAIGDAVDELLRERAADVLVFLSGEREIRDTAEALVGRLRSDVEVLPLYARLSSSEQQRVFKAHTRPRVVLATNVAETSLTVPGIRSVVDPGTARISRYSARLKVQRLPIEAISQASADQRMGRCGRTSEGICIRLYDEEDFAARPRFTDPEILRTSLAAVILQMAAIGLGEVEAFPFIDPPDRRQVRDGVRLLQELGALDDGGGLTQLGRRLAQLPVDPRMARMVLEAGESGCAEEVIVIAAALSIQDPRERPTDARQAADELHARFADPDSDFLAYLSLWNHLRELQRELSGNQFRKRCKAEFLNYLRVREWQDLVAQLRWAAKSVGVRRNQQPAPAEDVHRALLSGLLSHVGLREGERREYLGARGARFAIFPGSALARRPPAWAMAAELVETSRLWAREVARIDPRWIEPLAGHLVKSSYSEPRWERRRAAVVATERVTLYGLPVVAGRTVPYARIDPEAARALFIRRALVEGDWDTRHAFVRANAERIAAVEQLEDRLRRRDLLAGDEAVYAFFDERVPLTVVSGGHFDRWWRDARRARPDLLDLPQDVLLRADVAGALDPKARPDAWKQSDLVLPLSYRFAPGADDDGVTVHVPLKALPRLREVGFDWQIPALRLELVTALLRGLPKELRRPLVPLPEVAEQVHARLRPRKGRLVDQVADAVAALRGVTVPPDGWDFEKLPAHLRMTFRVEDERGRAIAAGKDLAALRIAARPALRSALTAAVAGLERTGQTSWTFGTLPRAVALPGTGDAVRAYPALVDEGDTVGVRSFETPAAQRAAMAAGTRKLLELTAASPVRATRPPVSFAAAPHGSAAAVLADVAQAALDALIAEAGGPAWDATGFEKLRSHVAGRWAAVTREAVGAVSDVLDAARDVERALARRSSADAFAPARRDVQRQLGRLLYPGFVAATGVARLADVERFLRAAERRLDRLPDALAADTDRMRVIGELEEQVDALAAARAGAVRDLRWMLEELRVASFAPALGTRGQVSVKRVRRALADARATDP